MIHNYKRNCPDCGKELFYASLRNLNRAITNKSVCANCRKMPTSLKKTLSKLWKGKKNPNYKRRAKHEIDKNYFRMCPECGEQISYVIHYAWMIANNNNSICNKCAMKHRIETIGKAFILTKDQINKMAATKAGYNSYEEYQNNISEFKKYKNKVMSITYKQPLSKLKNYNKKGKMGVDGAYNIDHIISIYKGFNHGIEPEVIGNIKNLKMIPWLDNIKKHKN